MEIFITNEVNCVQCVITTHTNAFENEEKARDYFNDVRKEILDDASIICHASNMVYEESENYFEAYIDGYATDWARSISLEKKELK